MKMGGIFSRCHAWLKSIRDPTIDDEHRAVNLVVGCLTIICGSPTTDVRAWWARKPERSLLRRPRQAVRSARGRRAIQDLLVLALAVAEADQPFRAPDISLLTTRDQKPISAEQQARMQAGRRRQKERMEHLRCRRINYRPQRKSHTPIYRNSRSDNGLRHNFNTW